MKLSGKKTVKPEQKSLMQTASPKDALPRRLLWRSGAPKPKSGDIRKSAGSNAKFELSALEAKNYPREARKATRLTCPSACVIPKHKPRNAKQRWLVTVPECLSVRLKRLTIHQTRDKRRNLLRCVVPAESGSDRNRRPAWGEAPLVCSP